MRQEAAYPAVQSICREYNVSICRMCAIAGIARASYYKGLNREIPEAELLKRLWHLIRMLIRCFTVTGAFSIPMPYFMKCLQNTE